MYFFFLYSMIMYLFFFCCNWFFFGLEKIDFLLVVCCILLLFFKKCFRVFYFYLRYCDSFVVNVRYMCRYCLFIKNNYNIILLRGIYIWFMIVVYLRNVWFDDFMRKINLMFFIKINWILYFFYFIDNEEKRERKVFFSSKIRIIIWYKYDTGVGVL